MLVNKRIQHPIGQGCFHSGEIEFAGHVFRYIYDCGSSSKKVLRNEIKRYAKSIPSTERVDVLFVSHFDEDHINGIEELLSWVDVKTVVVPYLRPRQRVVLAAEYSRSLGSSLSRFAISPTEWFQSLGVQQVLHVVGRGRDEGPEEVRFSLDSDSIRRDDSDDQSDVEIIYQRSGDGPDGEEFIVDKQGLVLRSGAKRLPWVFVAHVHDDGVDARNRVWDELVKVYPDLVQMDRDHDLSKWLKRVLKNGVSRAKLKACYQSVDSDHNRVSMSLYSGPDPEVDIDWTAIRTASLHSGCRMRYPFCEPYQARQVGWIGTGDSDLRGDGVWWRDFEQHFKACFGLTHTVLLPHHGSSHSCSGELLGKPPLVFVASAGDNNQYGHPHHQVVMEVLSSNSDFVCVAESRHTEYYEIAWVRWG